MAKAIETSTTSRRTLIAALAVAPIAGAVALPALAKPESAFPAIPATSEADAAMFVLRDKLADVRERIEAMMPLQTEAETALFAEDGPPKPQPTKPAGYDEWNQELLELLKSHWKREPRLSLEEKRKDEAAMRVWEARQSRLRRKTGVSQVEAEISRLIDEEDAIRAEMTELAALSVAGLKAKLSALLCDCDYPELNEAIIRDVINMTNTRIAW